MSDNKQAGATEFKGQLIQAFARNLKVERKKLKLTQDDIAQRAGISRVYIGLVERGEKNVTLDSVERLAGALGLPPLQLLSEAPESQDERATEVSNYRAWLREVEQLDPDSRYNLYMAVHQCRWKRTSSKSSWVVERELRERVRKGKQEMKPVYAIYGSAKVLLLRPGSRKKFLGLLDKNKGDDTHTMESWYAEIIKTRTSPLEHFTTL